MSRGISSRNGCSRNMEISNRIRYYHFISGVCARQQVLLRDARTALALLNPPADAVGQKKEGNCKMPEGVCFVKLSKKIIDLIEK
jgi:hypothetical protein